MKNKSCSIRINETKYDDTFATNGRGLTLNSPLWQMCSNPQPSARKTHRESL